MTTATTEKTLPQLCEELGFKLELKKAKTPHNASKWQMNCANSWIAILSFDGYSIAFPYFTGKLVSETSVADVVHSLTSDWGIWKDCGDVQGFANEFGWDGETLVNWSVLEHNSKKWEHFVGDVSILETLRAVEY